MRLRPSSLSSSHSSSLPPSYSMRLSQAHRSSSPHSSLPSPASTRCPLPFFHLLVSPYRLSLSSSRLSLLLPSLVLVSLLCSPSLYPLLPPSVSAAPTLSPLQTLDSRESSLKAGGSPERERQEVYSHRAEERKDVSSLFQGETVPRSEETAESRDRNDGDTSGFLSSLSAARPEGGNEERNKAIQHGFSDDEAEDQEGQLASPGEKENTEVQDSPLFRKGHEKLGDAPETRETHGRGEERRASRESNRNASLVAPGRVRPQGRREAFRLPQKSAQPNRRHLRGAHGASSAAEESERRTREEAGKKSGIETQRGGVSTVVSRDTADGGTPVHLTATGQRSARSRDGETARGALRLRAPTSREGAGPPWTGDASGEEERSEERSEERGRPGGGTRQSLEAAVSQASELKEGQDSLRELGTVGGEAGQRGGAGERPVEAAERVEESREKQGGEGEGDWEEASEEVRRAGDEDGKDQRGGERDEKKANLNLLASSAPQARERDTGTGEDGGDKGKTSDEETEEEGPSSLVFLALGSGATFFVFSWLLIKQREKMKRERYTRLAQLFES
ncbi:putative transmembrane protein [Toxoplasma gondii p89]|uniref:Putative transmembrane protein n=1 Tax=Toxoplasma gondii p89 TaxID=943119 RepID=A0A086KYC3_TOXGO|nr:putative transmembrane protein [Toxoplasma gondii p89]